MSNFHIGFIGNIIYLIFMSQIVFLRSTLVLSFCIDVVLTLDKKMSWHFTRNCVKTYHELGISFNSSLTSATLPSILLLVSSVNMIWKVCISIVFARNWPYQRLYCCGISGSLKNHLLKLWQEPKSVCNLNCFGDSNKFSDGEVTFPWFFS